jgi:hypothetical protein
VEREAIIVKSSDDGKRQIAIDKKNASEIIDFISQNNLAKKFDLICGLILDGIRNTELYDKEDINTKCKNVTAIKFKGKLNARIYCQELKSKGKTLIVIASELLESKKNQKNKSKEKNLIIKVGSYEYHIKET